MDRKTVKQVMTAWENGAWSRERPTDLMRELEAWLLAAPFGLAFHDVGRHMKVFADRIGRRIGHSHSKAVAYAERWDGEWTVTNRDLVAWSTFRMWTGRLLDGAWHTAITDAVAQALGGKRMTQAADRLRASGLTGAHCALIAALGWRIDTERGDWVSLYAEGKRPFGNSSIEADIYEAAGWEWPVAEGEDRPLADAESERAWDLFDELAFALPEVAKLGAAALERAAGGVMSVATYGEFRDDAAGSGRPQPNRDAVSILHNRYIKGRPDREASLEAERRKVRRENERRKAR